MRRTIFFCFCIFILLLAACQPGESTPAKTPEESAAAQATEPSISEQTPTIEEVSMTEPASSPTPEITSTPSLPGVESSIRYIYIVPMSHLDIGFTAPADVVAEQYKPNLDLALKYLGVFPGMSWNIENLWQLEQWLARSDEQEMQKLLEYIQARRLNLMASYASMHSAMLSPAEWQYFLYPARKAELAFSIDLITAVQNDVPGYSWALPQILSRAGIRYFLTGPNITAGGGGTTIPRKDIPFYWEGSDGSRVLTWISPDNYSEGLFVYKLNQKINDFYLKQAMEKWTNDGYPYDAILVQYAFDNQDADQLNIYQLVQNVELWNKTRQNPKLLLAPPEDFFKHMEETYGDQFPVYRGDWSGLWEQTKILSPAGTALIRTAKDNLLAAGAVTTLSKLMGIGEYPAQQVGDLYLDIVYYDEHSTGSIVPWPGLMTAEEINHDNAIHLELAQWIFSDSQALLSGSWETLTPAFKFQDTAAPEGVEVVVFNPLSWVRSGVVQISLQGVDPLCRNTPCRVVDKATGEVMLSQVQTGSMLFQAKDIPSLGYRRFLLEPTPEEPADEAANQEPTQAEISIENEYFRLTVDTATGEVVSLWDIVNQREVIFKNPPESGGTVVPFNALLRASHKSTFSTGMVEVVESGQASVEVSAGADLPLQSITVTRSGAIFQETQYRLEAGQPWLEVVNLLDRSKMPHVPAGDHSDLYFFAFPFNLDQKDLSLHLESAAGFLNPAQDLLPGANGRGFSVQNVSALTGSDGYTALLTQRESFLIFVNNVTRSGTFQGIEKPVLIAGAMAVAHEGSSKDKGVIPLVGGEPSAPPIHTFTYRIGVQADFDPLRASRMGWESRVPLLASLLLPDADTPGSQADGAALPFCRDAESQGASCSFFWFGDDESAEDGTSVMIAELKGATFGDTEDIILRLQEVSGETVEVTLNSAFTIEQAAIVSVTEEALNTDPPILYAQAEIVDFSAGKTLRLKIPGNAMITLRLRLGR